MTLITISRDSYSHGKEIAQKVARRLGCDCIGRQVILDAADAFSVSPGTMRRALHDAPSALESLFNRKERHLAEFGAAFYRTMSRGNVVYHGLAGHMFLKDVPQVLKVRIVANFEDRVREEMEREGVTESVASQRLHDDDRERCHWTRRIYGVDNHDPALYDLCLNLQSMSVDEAVEAILDAAERASFRVDEKALKHIVALADAAEIKAHLLRTFSNVHTLVLNGEVQAVINAPLAHEDRVLARARKIMTQAGLPQAKASVQPNIL